MEIIVDSLNTIREAARQFIAHFKLDLPTTDESLPVFAFYAPMGTGKTTFVKAICEELGVADAINSPTFAIVNEYKAADSRPIYHFDFYRIKRLSEACDIGIDDYFYSGNPCFIEWPELIEELLPEEAIRIEIEELPDGRRCVKDSQL